MKKYLYSIFSKVSEKIPELSKIQITFDVPKNEEFGDYSSNAAMLLTKVLKKNPRQIASEIIEALEIDENIISKIEIAGPGFINFYFTPDYIVQIIEEINTKKENFVKTNINKGKKALVEFVSANPTGPLTMGHGRNAVLGDIVANLLEWSGYQVDREYYFNNAGRQMRVLGDSVKQRYLQLFDDKIDFPEDYYQGEYIVDIAKSLYNEFGNKLADESAEGIFKDKAEAEIFADIKNTLERISIVHDSFFNEDSLYKERRIEKVVELLKSKDLVYEQDGALWFRYQQFGREKDKALIKSSGEPTYRLPDIAYHITKFERNYDLMIDIFGADHIDTYPDVLIALKELGYDTEKIMVLIHQFVTVFKEGKAVKMSTRKANYITIDEIVDETSSDVVRYFFTMRDKATHLNFDLDLAKKQSDENPVFYLQYAHARICSILRMIENENLEESYLKLNLLNSKEELQLIKVLHQYETEINSAVKLCEPHRVCNYLELLAASFHKFYTVCRIIGVEKELSEARISLIIAVKNILSNGLKLLSISAPERM